MNTLSAYIGVVLIWSTTPLAIKLSTSDQDYLAPLVLRNLIGFALTVLCLSFINERIRMDRKAWLTYGSSALSIALAMLLTYWAAQFVNAGVIAICYALSPIITALFANLILKEQRLSTMQLLFVGIAILGLSVTFNDQLSATQIAQAEQYLAGLIALCLAVLVYALSAVLVKRYGSNMHPLSVNAGSLLVATPLLMLPYFGSATAFELPRDQAFGATIYLGVIGSFFGFVLYFYVLRRLPASQAMSVPVITPILAMILAHIFFGEAITWVMAVGALAVAGGLAGFLTFGFKQNS